MVMTRKFVDREGYVLEESEWRLRPYDTCFYCDEVLLDCADTECPVGFLGLHDFVTVCQFSVKH